MLKLELKRIFSKKINVFAIGLALILAVIFSGFAVTSNRYVDENGNASTGIMATRKLTDNRRAWKGTLTEDELGKVIEQNKNAMTQSSEENAIYGTTLQPIDDIRGFIISVLTPDAEYDESVLNQITEENIQEFSNSNHRMVNLKKEENGIKKMTSTPVDLPQEFFRINRDIWQALTIKVGASFLTFFQKQLT